MTIQFVDDSPETALSEVLADVQSIMNRTLHNADPEMLLVNAMSYRASLYRKQLNYTGNQNLITDATGLALDLLGQKNGSYRLSASAAVVTVRFTIEAGAPTLVIPSGTRVKSADGAVIFKTTDDVNVPSGTATIDIDCTCIITGIVGNGYLAGMITQIVDPVAYVSSAANTETSAGGSDEETDDQFRARIPLANATYSVAGPEDAYIYFAKTASPSIVDVSIDIGPVAGGIQTSAINNGGTGWDLNDEFTIDGGTILALGTVTGMAAGVVTSYKLIVRGSDYSVAAGVTTTAITGAGTGLLIDITAVTSFMTVSIYPLLAGGVLPNQAMLDAVMAICSDKKVRPLSDTVVALAPTPVTYSLNVLLTIKKGYDSQAIRQTVQDNLNGFVNQWDKALGVDLIVNQFKGQCTVDGVYDLTIPSFTANVSIGNNEFGSCTGVIVSIASIVEEA